MRIGILSLQGDFDKHAKMFDSLGIRTSFVRSEEDIQKIDSLVIPGGESTTIGKLILTFGLNNILEERINKESMPVMGTCAGMILLAKEIASYEQYSVSALDICVERNAYGRQIESFEADIEANLFHSAEKTTIRGVFIRAPLIKSIGPGVKILARHEEKPVLIRQNNILAMSFHPELTQNTVIHEYFCEMTQKVIQHNS